MRTLLKNKKPFSYSLFKDKAPIIDDYGNETGEYKITYSEPVSIFGNISPATGQSQIEQFGGLENYDKVIVVDDMNCPIDERSVLYVDSFDKYDYIVKRVAKSLNHISYAVSKVDVTCEK